jgi:alkylated DNA repair dioxygenase AlkB
MPGGECAAVEGFKAKHGPGAPSNAKPVTFIEYVDVDEHTYTEEGPVEIQLDRQGSFLHYFPSFLDHGTLRSLREELEASLNAARERTHAFGLDAFTSEGGHHQWFAWGSDWRANTRWRRQAWPLETESELAPIVAIKAAVDDQVQTVVQGVSPFNSVLVNRYANGKAHIKWHADDECCYGDAHNSTIGSVSFGAPRLFCLRRKVTDHRGQTQQLLRRISLQSGSLLIMGGSTQAHWQHSLPPDETCGDVPRINLTFRHVFFDKTMKHHHASKTLALLEEKSLLVLKDALCNHTRVAFFNTLNVGDCILMHMLWRLRCEGASAGGAQVSTGCNCETVVVDSGHLFADTLPFLADMEALYAFKAHLVSRAPGVSRAEVAAATGALSPPMQDSLHYCEVSSTHMILIACQGWSCPRRRELARVETHALVRHLAVEASCIFEP